MWWMTSVAWAGPAWSTIKQDTGWEHVSDRSSDVAGTVQVFQRAIDGMTCFKGIATTDLPIDTLFSVAYDVPGTRTWSTAGIKEAVVFDQSSDSMDYYQYLDVPGWTMASDRYWFLKGKIVKQASVQEFSWDRIPETSSLAPKMAEIRAQHADAVEPPINAGGWQFSQQGTAVQVAYFICSDVGGTIPTAVQTMGTKQTLPDNVSDLIREAKKRAGR